MQNILLEHHEQSDTPAPARVRTFAIGAISFLTLVDLFAAQAILPQLAALYGVSAAEIGVAVNASTLGMAVAGPIAAAVLNGVARRNGIYFSLAILAVPTALLAIAPDLTIFSALRIAQGMCMASAFTLALAHFAERCRNVDTAKALAAYVTGGVAANLVGRLIVSFAAEQLGAPIAFLLMAGLNLAGALLAFATITHVAPMPPTKVDGGRRFDAFARHLRNARLRRAFLLGFLILFAFVGVFSYVGFRLAAEPISLSARDVGLVFLCFAPSLITTPLAGACASRFGSRDAAIGSLIVAQFGVALLFDARLASVIVGLSAFAAGTFFAQAVATGFVGRNAAVDKAAASGLYLAAYYFGGLAGAYIVGQLYVRWGWPAALTGVAISLVVAALVSRGLHDDGVLSRNADASASRVR